MGLTVAVTGGIGAGKSTLSRLLADRGAVVVDSDLLAREVVAPGTPGLTEIADAFGPGVLTATGELDRAALAGVVFADPESRRRLEAITHPRVRQAFRDRVRAAGPDQVVVNDIPLLRDVAAAASFHLVVGVWAPTEVKVARLVLRGLTEADARARIAAQIGDDSRIGLCDLWWSNGGSAEELEPLVGELWAGRLRLFRNGVRDGVTAPRGAPVLIDPDSGWAAAAGRLAARVGSAADGARVDHVGPTAIPGMPAKDVIDLQLTVPDLGTADRLRDRLRRAGFPARPGDWWDTAHPSSGDPAVGGHWAKRFHQNADPGRAVNLHVRVRESPGWRFALMFPAWLRADPGVAAEYLAAKRAASAVSRASGETDEWALSARYQEAKEPWFASAHPRCLAWAARTGWTPGPG